MVSCKQCQTPNSLDSTFCKRCGTAISDIELQEAQAKLEKLIEEGNTLFNQGRIDEALAVAEAANLANPSSISALSLKTLCHERRGELAEALECADRLVELNPASDFDRIRRASLRQRLQTDLHVPAAPDRRLAAMGAGAAIVLVLCIGMFVAKVNANSPSHVASNNPAGQPSNFNSTAAPQSPPANSPVQNTAGTGTNPGTTTSSAPTPGSVGPLKDGREQPTSEGNPGVSPANLGLPKTSGTTLPLTGSDETSGGVQPITIDPKNIVVEKGPATPTTSSNNVHPDEGEPTTSVQNHTEPPKAKIDDPGTISVTVHPGSGRPSNRNVGGAEPVGTTGLEALVRVGSQQFQLGNYAGAAKSYEQAVRAGGDGVILNRRLAQAYERLGRTGEATDAYRRCISAVDSALASGRGNRENLSNTRSLCEQALKVLQGG